MNQLFFRCSEAAQILAVSVSTIRRLAERGVIHVEYFGPASPRYRLPRTSEEWKHYRSLSEKAFAGTRKRTRNNMAITSEISDVETS